MPPRAPGLRLPVHLEIHILHDALLASHRALVGELRRRRRLGFRGLVNHVVLLLGERAFLDQPALENLNRVVALLVVLDLLLLPVAAGVLRVGDAVAVVAVSGNFQHRRLLLGMRAFDRGLHCGAHFVDVRAVALRPAYRKPLGTLGEAAFESGTPREARAHRVAVVFDDVDHRDVEERRHVQALVEATLVHRAVAHEAHRRALHSLVFQCVGEAEAERRLPADDAVAAPVVFVRREEVHRAALALRAAGGLAKQFGHALVHGHSDCESMAVATVGGDDVIVVAHERYASYGHGFLAIVEMQEAAHFFLRVLPQRLALEAADAHHVGEEPQLSLGGKFGVDRSRGKIGGRDSGGHELRFVGVEI